MNYSLLRILMRSTLCGIRPGFPGLFLTIGYVPTRYSAVRRSCILGKARIGCRLEVVGYSKNICNLSPVIRNLVFEPQWEHLPLDLHILGTPPAFILSQDQTLHKWTLTLICTTQFSMNALRACYPSAQGGRIVHDVRCSGCYESTLKENAQKATLILAN